MTDQDLLRQFETGLLPRAQWTHTAHVRVAALYLMRHDFEAALERMRFGIHAYNALHPPEEGSLSGYHETITVAFMRLIDAAIADDTKRDVQHDCSLTFCAQHPELLDKRIIQQFYSRTALERPEAKRTFVAPDRAPLPPLPPAPPRQSIRRLKIERR